MAGKQQVSPERTGWRDEEISRRHRDYGIALPAVDMDFVLIEYDSAEVCAVIEHKRYTAKPVNLNSTSIVAMSRFATKGEVPFYIVRYWPATNTEPWYYEVMPVNSYASEYVSRKMMMSEKTYVNLLYRLRHQFMPDEIAVTLGDYIPF